MTGRFVRATAALTAAAFLASSCATVQVVDIKPVKMPQPVSASRFVPWMTRASAGPESYDIIREFSISRRFDTPQNTRVVHLFDLETELRALIEESGADAIVELRITPRERDPGLTFFSGMAYTGAIWTGMLSVAMFIMSSVHEQSNFITPNDYKPAAYISGGICAAFTTTGAALSLLSKPYVLIDVSGKLVKFRK